MNKQNNKINQGQRTTYKFFDVSKGDDSQLYYIKESTKMIFKISKVEFNSRHGTILSHKNKVVKVEGLSKRSQKIELVKKVFSRWSGQSNIKHVISGIKLLISTLQKLGQFNETKTYYFRKAKNCKTEVLRFCTDLAALLFSFLKITWNKFQVSSLIDMCVELFRTFTSSQSLFDKWKGESLTAVGLSALSMFLPKNLFEILRRMSLFTSAKLLDDTSQLFSLFMLFIDYVKSLLSYLPFELPEFISKSVSKLSNISHFSILAKSKELYSLWKSHPKSMLDENFRNDVKTNFKDVCASEFLIENTRRSEGTRRIFNQIKQVNSSVVSYETSLRIEPTCFVFEGPPGCLKSVIMNGVIKTLGKTSYVHNTKSSTDGKDWYDGYNNEEVFFMDDVGQQGVSQWRNIINFVSPVKLPLDCASADLKDTKFFTSNTLLLTTNKFSELQGLTKTDGISDLKALWRRGLVFDFRHVSRVGGELEGDLYFKFYNLQTNRWEYDFPVEFKRYILSKYKINSTFNANEDTNKLNIIAWIVMIVKIFEEIKENQFNCNSVEKDEITTINDLMSQYQAENDIISDTDDEDIDEFESTYDDVEGDVTSTEEKNKAMLFCDFAIEIWDILVNYIKTLVYDIEDFLFTHVLSSNGNYQWLVYAGILGIFNLCIYMFIKLIKKFKTLSHTSSDITDAHYYGNSDVNVTNVKHTGVRKVADQTYEISLIHPDYTNKHNNSVGLFSGKYMLTTYHTCNTRSATLIVYKNREANHRIIDHIHVKRVYDNSACDLAIWEMPNNYPTPFKNLSTFFQGNVIGNKHYLLRNGNAYDISAISADPIIAPTIYSIKMVDNNVFSTSINIDDFYYTMHGKGMCGSVIVSENGKVRGMHVAGNAALETGVAMKFSTVVLNDIFQILSGNHNGLKLDCQISDKVFEDFSGLKLVDNNIQSSVPKKTNFIPSPLFNVFEISRIPANLSVNGPHTVKDVAKKSFKPVCGVNNEEIEFASKWLRSIIEPFDKLCMRDVILGTSKLARINKHSSNGFNTPKDKLDCIDYENGCLMPEFNISYSNFLNKLSHGAIKLEDVVSVETLKDELRGIEKDLPRSFRVSRLHFQLLMKSMFGRMVENIITDKWFNGIMVGVNPYQDWPKMYHTFKDHLVWAGDIKNWDGQMLPQVQSIISDILISKLEASEKDKDLAGKILGLSIHCPVVVNDDIYMTTHSMPSGIFLTAILNSLVNRFYTAMWYYRSLKSKGLQPVVSNFNLEVGDYVYGDDKLNFLKKEDNKDVLNALTMTQFFESIGMGFTDSKKNPILKPFEDLSTISFLKREFVYHPLLKQIVGPLDLRTIYSGLSYVDSSKDINVVLSDKINAFQREIFLHYDRYDEDVRKLSDYCYVNHIPIVVLPRHYLMYLYESNEYDLYDERYGLRIQ